LLLLSLVQQVCEKFGSDRQHCLIHCLFSSGKLSLVENTLRGTADLSKVGEPSSQRLFMVLTDELKGCPTLDRFVLGLRITMYRRMCINRSFQISVLVKISLSLIISRCHFQNTTSRTMESQTTGIRRYQLLSSDRGIRNSTFGKSYHLLFQKSNGDKLLANFQSLAQRLIT